MISYKEALCKVREKAMPLSSERLATAGAVGRVLFEDVLAVQASPSFDNSQVDGYAFGGGDPPFKIVGKSVAGAGDLQDLENGQAARIFTGARIPPGTLSMAMIEDCEVDGKAVTPRETGRFIRRRGEDFGEGHRIAHAGDLITPPLLGLITTAGVFDVMVHRLPRVTVVTTGDEVMPLGHDLIPGQICNSSGPSIVAALAQFGINAAAEHVRDDLATIQLAIERALKESDVLITCGGVSVGDRDYLKEAFALAGVEESFWRAAIKPGKPLYFGHRQEKLVFGLPGNPVSSSVTFYLFVRPALLSLMGHRDAWKPGISAKMKTAVSKTTGKTDFMRGNLIYQESEVWVEATAGQGSHMLLGTGHAHCLIVVPADSEGVESGQIVEVIPLQWGLM